METDTNSTGRSLTYKTETELILIAHPNRDIALRYREWVPNRYTVQIATSGYETLANYSREIGVVILDENLNDQSPTDVATEIQQSDTATQVVLFSDDRTPILGESDDPMCDSYLTKGATELEFRIAIDHFHRRAVYNRLFDQYYALARERAKLETNSLAGEPAKSARYAEIEAEMMELETMIDELHVSFDQSDYASLFRELNK